jgi:HNH endonuclease
MPVKGSGTGLRVTFEGYLEVTRRGPYRGIKAHRVYMERLLGRPLRKDEEVHHICRNRACWPPSDGHLLLCDAALHHATDAGVNPLKRKKAKRENGISNPMPDSEQVEA